SKDRRMATRLAYHYFRIGKAVPMASRDLRLAYGELLCSTESGVVQYVLPDLYPYIQETIPQKIALLEERTDFRLADVFPYIAHLSAGIDQVALLTSLFIQPDLFIRIQRVY